MTLRNMGTKMALSSLSLAAVVALGCGGERVLVGNLPDTVVTGMGGAGVGGAGTVTTGVGGAGTGGHPIFTGAAGNGGAIPTAPSCTTISTTPGVLNPCGATSGIAISPDNQLLAQGLFAPSPDHQIQIWRLSDGSLLHQMAGFLEAAYTVEFSPDGTLLAAAGESQTGAADTDIVKIFDVASGNLARVIPATCGFYASGLAFSPDGTLLATAGYTGPIEIWQVANGTRVSSMPYPNSVHNLHFSPDGTQLIAGGDDKRATIWSTTTWTQTGTLSIADEMADAEFSPDGKLIASTAPDDKSVRVWDAATGALLQELPGHTHYISHTLWINNDRFVSDDWSGEVRLWSRGTAGTFANSDVWQTGSQALGIAYWASPNGPMVVTGGGTPTQGFVFLSLQLLPF